MYRDGATKSVIYSPIKERDLTEAESKGITLNISMRIDPDIRMLFLAKAILGAGYFTYGDIFVKHADHVSLRKLMNYKYFENKESIEKLPLWIMDNLRDAPTEMKQYIAVKELICQSLGGSCVIFWYQKKRIAASVGISGKYIGTITFNANLDQFPNDRPYEFGHVLGIQKSKLKRGSFQKTASMIYHKIRDRN